MICRSWSRFVFAALFMWTTIVATAGEVTVSAASSLTNAFNEIARAYEAQNTGSRVLLNFGASGALVQQIAKGAPVDVLASADQETMDLAEKKGLVAAAERHNFVRNLLVAVVPKEASAFPRKIDDLTQPAFKRIAIGNPASVPIGRYSRRALVAAECWDAVSVKAIHTQNVRQSLDYVARGEVDVGFVYITDANTMKDKINVAFEVPLDISISYPIAVIKNSNNAGEARRFVAFVLSPPGQAILASHGFLKP